MDHFLVDNSASGCTERARLKKLNLVFSLRFDLSVVKDESKINQTSFKGT